MYKCEDLSNIFQSEMKDGIYVRSTEFGGI